MTLSEAPFLKRGDDGCKSFKVTNSPDLIAENAIKRPQTRSQRHPNPSCELRTTNEEINVNTNNRYISITKIVLTFRTPHY